MYQRVRPLFKNIILYHHLRSRTRFWWYFYFMEEIFKDIPGYEGTYQVSNYGRIKSFKRNTEKILKGTKDKDGYSVVFLCKDGNKKHFKFHQLVAIAFLNHTPCGMKLVINHIDFDKTNNKLYNLEIVTTRENSNKKHINSTSKYVGVSWCNRAKKWKSGIKINRKMKHLGYFKDEFEAHFAYTKALYEILNPS